MNTKVEDVFAVLEALADEFAGINMGLQADFLCDARTTLAAHIAQQDATIARMRHVLEELMDAASDFRQLRQERDYHRAAWRGARAALNQGEG